MIADPFSRKFGFIGATCVLAKEKLYIQKYANGVGKVPVGPIFRAWRGDVYGVSKIFLKCKGKKPDFKLKW